MNAAGLIAFGQITEGASYDIIYIYTGAGHIIRISSKSLFI